MNKRQLTNRGVLAVNTGLKVVLLVVLSSSCFAVSQHAVFSNNVAFKSTELTGVKGLDLEKATLANPNGARDFLRQMRRVQGCPIEAPAQGAAPDPPAKKDCVPLPDEKHKNNYVLINILRWSSSSTPDKPKVDAENWYLYRDGNLKDWSQEDFTSAKRLMGVTKVYVLYVHLNGGDSKLVTSDGATYIPVYDFTITKKTPANVAHLYALLGAFAAGANPTAATGTKKDDREVFDAVWGGGTLDLQYRPSDIVIKSTFRPHTEDPDQKLADDMTFDNEGAYLWDVGFAVPVRKISELKLDSTSGTATPANVNSVNVFAVLDGYFRPVDVKGSGFNAIPHPIAGVAFAKQPLSKILIGGAWGPKASELYLGAMFVKQQELSGTNSCGNPSGMAFTGRSHYCAQFTIGINLSVSAIASKLGAPK